MKPRRPTLLALLFLAPVLTIAHGAEADYRVQLTSLPDRIRVEIGGQLFTEYIFKGAKRPYCYPVLAVDGTSMVRDFPMKETPGEDVDHPHHRSLWFAHSNVNGIDFWNEGTAGTRFPKGSIEHVGLRLVDSRSGKIGVVCSTNRWLAPDGKLVCTDETTIRFRGNAEARMIDFEVTLKALPNEPLVMGDNKDGTMAIRLAQWLTMPHKIQQKDIPGVGHIATAKGLRDSAAWGTKADWCDYFAERNGKTYGVAIFDHPENLRHPTWWMARDYGLFGANPFGQHDFEPKENHPADKGNYTIPAGGRLTLRYRFYFHTGDDQAAGISARYAEYTADK